MQNWVDSTNMSLTAVWDQVIMYVPRLIGAAVIFIVGLIVASVLSSLLHRALTTIKVDEAVSSTGIDKEFEKAGVQLSISKFFSRLVYWFVVIATVVLITDNLFAPGTLTNLLKPVLEFIPQVAAAVIILIGAVLLANFVKRVVQAAIVGAKIHAPTFVANIAWWSVVIFGFIAALGQLRIGDFIVNIAFYAVVATFFGIALAFGLAFGLGGKETAAEWLKHWKAKM